MALLNVELNYQNQGVLDFIALAVMQSFYLRWDYNNPERCEQTQSQNPKKTKKDNRKLIREQSASGQRKKQLTIS